MLFLRSSVVVLDVGVESVISQEPIITCIPGSTACKARHTTWFTLTLSKESFEHKPGSSRGRFSIFQRTNLLSTCQKAFFSQCNGASINVLSDPTSQLSQLYRVEFADVATAFPGVSRICAVSLHTLVQTEFSK